MNITLDKYLVEKYPKIFKKHNGDILNSAMSWGFEFNGDGWFWLIDNLCGCIQSYIDSNDHLNITQVVATQVKSKFAALRFYFYGGNDEIEGMVSLAEDMSYHICEFCGTTKNVGLLDNGWMSTLCENCAKKQLGDSYNGKIWKKEEVPANVESILAKMGE